MARHRFYAPPSSIEGEGMTLDASESYHLRHVLRLGRGATVFVFDGSGVEYVCQLEGFDRDRARLGIIERTEPAVECPLALTLGQSLTRGEKFEFIIQKTIELGVRRIVPLITARTPSTGIRSVSETRQRRWQRIALEATKQCGRTRLTDITQPLAWQEFLADLPQPAILLSEHGGKRLSDLPRQWPHDTPPRCILVGPEGGWEQAEVEAAEAVGATILSLGPRILRAETAAVVGVGLVQCIFSDM